MEKLVRMALDKLDNVCGFSVPTEDCYNITCQKGPYGISDVVAFCVRDEPNDFQVVAYIDKGKVTFLAWNAEDWDIWGLKE